MVGTNDLNKSITYYDTLLDLLDLKRVDTSDDYAAYASKNNPKNIEFYVTKPANGDKANFGNGTQISFITNTKEVVEKFRRTSQPNTNTAPSGATAITPQTLGRKEGDDVLISL